jgi:hypothetical protein
MHDELFDIANIANKKITNEDEYNNAVACSEYLRTEIQSYKDEICRMVSRLSNSNIVITLSAYSEVYDDLCFRIEEWEDKERD